MECLSPAVGPSSGRPWTLDASGVLMGCHQCAIVVGMMGEEIGSSRCKLWLHLRLGLLPICSASPSTRGAGVGIGCPCRQIGRASHGRFLFLLCSPGSCQELSSEPWELGFGHPTPSWLPATPHPTGLSPATCLSGGCQGALL